SVDVDCVGRTAQPEAAASGNAASTKQGRAGAASSSTAASLGEHSSSVITLRSVQKMNLPNVGHKSDQHRDEGGKHSNSADVLFEEPQHDRASTSTTSGGDADDRSTVSSGEVLFLDHDHNVTNVFRMSSGASTQTGTRGTGKATTSVCITDARTTSSSISGEEMNRTASDFHVVLDVAVTVRGAAGARSNVKIHREREKAMKNAAARGAVESSTHQEHRIHNGSDCPVDHPEPEAIDQTKQQVAGEKISKEPMGQRLAEAAADAPPVRCLPVPRGLLNIPMLPECEPARLASSRARRSRAPAHANRPRNTIPDEETESSIEEEDGDEDCATPSARLPVESSARQIRRDRRAAMRLLIDPNYHRRLSMSSQNGAGAENAGRAGAPPPLSSGSGSAVFFRSSLTDRWDLQTAASPAAVRGRARRPLQPREAVAEYGRCYKEQNPNYS
ncbi:unnamed protein product, partial [Amoebophrya sp. A25]